MKATVIFVISLNFLLLAESTLASSACLLDPERGFGTGQLTRWYFNHTTQTCKSFKWSGWDGVVPFRWKYECIRAKCASSKCLQKPSNQEIFCIEPQWFFNKESGTCESTNLGPCGKLPFSSRKECVKEQCNPRCTLLPKTGPCRAAFPKYFFNQKTGKCQRFIWGGCAGTVPFDTLDECKKAECISSLPTPSPSSSITPTPSPSPSPSPLPRRCLLRPNTGLCLALFTRWYWDNNAQKCTSFIWGGCGGVVPFKTKKDCEEAGCSHPDNPNGMDKCDVTTDELLPVLQPGEGTCLAFLTSWYFDKASGKCMSQSYSGCSPVGPFDSQAECEAAGCGDGTEEDKCMLKKSDVLPDLPPGTATCTAAWTSWYYDDVTGKCTSFFYSGCAPVGPFESKQQCKAADCGDMKNKCEITKEDVLPQPSPGTVTCLAVWTSWYYDATSMKCMSFTYSGCSPVGPFSSQAMCESACP